MPWGVDRTCLISSGSAFHSNLQIYSLRWLRDIFHSQSFLQLRHEKWVAWMATSLASPFDTSPEVLSKPEGSGGVPSLS